MRAAFAVSVDPQDSLAGLVIGQRPDPEIPEGWARVRVRAAALNHHDVWSLRGVGLPDERLPMILGCDAAGEDDEGRPVVVHAVISSAGWDGDETLDPRRTLLSELHHGTIAEYVVVPRRNLVPKPEALSWAEAACLPTAWLTAYRMLFTRAQLRPGQTVLVQGAGGGVATAVIVLGAAAGLRVWATSGDDAKRARALELGAAAVFERGARLPERVDAVMETVGAATWSHTLRCLRPGGTVVVCGTTSGSDPTATELDRIFFQQLSILGSTMGTREELEHLMSLLVVSGARPVIDSQISLDDVRVGLRRLIDGNVFGKIVVRF